MNYISINPKIRFGKPCIKGTRIAVSDVLNLLMAGYTIDEVPEQYPGINKTEVLAAVKFATKLAEEPTEVMFAK